jgi:hypothetical protein
MCTTTAASVAIVTAGGGPSPEHEAEEGSIIFLFI